MSKTCIFLSKDLQISVKCHNFASDFNRILNFI